jgi:hypothetical protein
VCTPADPELRGVVDPTQYRAYCAPDIRVCERDRYISDTTVMTRTRGPRVFNVAFMCRVNHDPAAGYLRTYYGKDYYRVSSKSRDRFVPSFDSSIMLLCCIDAFVSRMRRAVNVHCCVLDVCVDVCSSQTRLRFDRTVC